MANQVLASRPPRALRRRAVRASRTELWPAAGPRFDDPLPDGWGLLLMDRHFRLLGRDPAEVGPLDRLAFLATWTKGALTYHPPVGRARRQARNRPIATAAPPSSSTAAPPSARRFNGSESANQISSGIQSDWVLWIARRQAPRAVPRTSRSAARSRVDPRRRSDHPLVNRRVAPQRTCTTTACSPPSSTSRTRASS